MVTPGHVVKEVRKRARLTQSELAARMGTKQEAVARWESGRGDIGFKKMQDILRACGFQFVFSIANFDDSDLRMAEEGLEMTVMERLDYLNEMLAAEEILHQAIPLGKVMP